MKQGNTTPHSPAPAPRMPVAKPNVAPSGSVTVPAIGAANMSAPPKPVVEPVAVGPSAAQATQQFTRVVQIVSDGPWLLERNEVRRAAYALAEASRVAVPFKLNELQIDDARQRLDRAQAKLAGLSVQASLAHASPSAAPAATVPVTPPPAPAATPVANPPAPPLITKAQVVTVGGKVAEGAVKSLPYVSALAAAHQANEGYQAARAGNLRAAGEHAGEVAAAVGTAIAATRPAVQSFLMGAHNVGSIIAASGVPLAMGGGKALAVGAAAVAAVTVGLRETGGAVGAAVQRSREQMVALSKDDAYTEAHVSAAVDALKNPGEIPRSDLQPISPILTLFAQLPPNLSEKAAILQARLNSDKTVTFSLKDKSLYQATLQVVQQMEALAVAPPSPAASEPVCQPSVPALTNRVLHVAQHGDVMTRIADSNTQVMKNLRKQVSEALGNNKPRNVLNVLAIVLADANAAVVKDIDHIQPGTRLMEPSGEDIARYVEQLKDRKIIDAQGNISPGFTPRTTPVGHCPHSVQR